jgi:hypothetical protein
MPKAVLKNGVIMPLEPLPAEWADGRKLVVEDAAEDDNQDFDTWLSELESLIAANDPAELARIDQTIHAADEQAKTLVRKEMGLP